MKISKVLYTSKTLADGTHPVMIRISSKGEKKYISTKQSCRANHWSKTKDLIGSKDPNSEMKNRDITALYLKLQNRLSEIQQSDVTPTIDLLLSNVPIKNEQKDKTNLISAYELKASACKAPRTANEYRTFQKVMQVLYGDFVDFNTISQVWVNELREKIDAHYVNENSQKNHFIKCFKGVYAYAENIGLIPYRRAIELKTFRHTKKEKFLSVGEVSTIISAYKKDIVIGVELPPKQKLALSIFILMMAFQGIANIDLAGLKLSNLTQKTICKIDVNWEQYHNNKEYRDYIDKEQQEREVIVVKIPRRKTQMEVEIVTDYISISPILDELMKGKNENDYLIPCFSAKTQANPKKEIERCSNFFSTYKKHLNDYLLRFYNLYKDQYTLVQDLTYYQARAAFVNQVVEMDIPHNLIQKMLGQKQTVLERHYIKPLSEWEQSEISYQIFNREETIANLLAQR